MLHNMPVHGAGIPLAVALADEAFVYRFPFGHAEAAKRGERNTHFLDGERLREHLRHAENGTSAVHTIIFPIAHVYATEGLTFRNFLDRLDAFLNALPGNNGRYAVEVRNSGYLQPAYFDCLSRRGVAHVLGDAVPLSLLDQIQLPHVLTAGQVIVRTTAGIDPVWKLGMVEIVRRCLTEKKRLMVFLTEGERCSVERAYAELMDMLNHDLAKLSPIRTQAA
jgi:hypothetical protein